MSKLDNIKDAFHHFFPDGYVLNVEKQSSGTINNTYKINTTIGIYIVQKISHQVFGERLDALEFNYKLFLNEYEKYGLEKTGICTWAEIQDFCFMSRNASTYAYWL